MTLAESACPNNSCLPWIDGLRRLVKEPFRLFSSGDYAALNRLGTTEIVLGS
jgi:hypothetical protein